MEKEEISEMFIYDVILTWLIARGFTVLNHNQCFILLSLSGSIRFVSFIAYDHFIIGLLTAE